MRKKYYRPDAPCKNCAERNADCHSVCEKYKDFREKLELYNHQERVIKDGYNAAFRAHQFDRSSEVVRITRKNKGTTR